MSDFKDPPASAQAFSLKLLQMLGHQLDASGWGRRTLIMGDGVETHFGINCKVHNCNRLFILSGTNGLYMGRHVLMHYSKNPVITMYYVMGFHINSSRNSNDYVRIITKNEDYGEARRNHTCVRYANLR